MYNLEHFTFHYVDNDNESNQIFIFLWAIRSKPSVSFFRLSSKILVVLSNPWL